MSNYDNLLLNNQLCFALYAATNTIVRSYRTKLDEVGITYPQYLVLILLWESDGLSIGAIAEKLKLDSAMITPLVKRLEKIGIVSRVRKKEDERIVEVLLTDKGRELEHAVAKMQNKVACETELSDPEFYKLRDTLYKLEETMRKNLLLEEVI